MGGAEEGLSEAGEGGARCATDLRAPCPWASHFALWSASPPSVKRDSGPRLLLRKV